MIKLLTIVMMGASAAFIFSCTTRVQPSPPQKSSTPETTPQMKLISLAFKEGEAIPRQFTCDGINVSPPLEWSGVPKTAKTIAIIADDPDAPNGTWVHWVLYNLPADNIGMVENLPSVENMTAGGFQGKTDFGKVGYGGPCPPSGTHRYFFKAYAVDSELPLKAGATKDELLKAMENHIVAQAQLMGTYRR
jgi:Raf kinase inhibitor-like YbhB/YbcL family protein